MPTLIGKLEIINSLSEIASNGTQSSAQINLFGYTVSLTGNFATSGGFPVTFITTASTTLTLPTTGVLLTTGGAMSGGTINNTPIGATTPSSGVFTTLKSTNTFTPSTTFGIVGTTLADNADAGSVGEFMSNSLTSGSATPITTGVPTNIITLSLTPGDWDCVAQVGFITSVGATVFEAWLNTVSATVPGVASGFGFTILNYSTSTQGGVLPVSRTRINISTTTTLYMGASAAFTSGTASAYGFMSARRVR
jgi:hypothetical protein